MLITILLLTGVSGFALFYKAITVFEKI